MNVSIFWDACVHRLHLGLYSHSKEFGEWSPNPCYLQEENPLRGDRPHDAASSRTASPTCYQRATPPPPPVLTNTIPHPSLPLPLSSGHPSPNPSLLFLPPPPSSFIHLEILLEHLFSLSPYPPPLPYHLKTLATTRLLSCPYPLSLLSPRLVGNVVKASASRADDPGFESLLRRDFSGSSHTCDFKIGTPVATLSGAWSYRVSAETCRPGVSIL